MDLTILLTIIGLFIAAISTGYTYLSYRSQKHSVDTVPLTNSALRSLTLRQLEITNGAERLIMLLLIDQFPNGIWGASLETGAEYYGHKGDPGSISISTQSTLAITAATGSRYSREILAYRHYLLARQSPRGAFGMLRETGTAKYPETQILEHSRHTATALLFFLHYDGLDHPAVQGALRFLLDVENRTTGGLWVDYGPMLEERVDPITVAFIVGALEQVRTAMKQIGLAASTDFTTLTRTIDAAVTSLFGSKWRTAEGGWIYRYSNAAERELVLRNTHQYTTDVLVYAAPAIARTAHHVQDALDVIERLNHIRARYGGGLPVSHSSHVVSLDPTANLLIAQRDLGQTITQHDLDQVLEFCSDGHILEMSNASGWAAALSLADIPAIGEPFRCAPERFEQLSEVAHGILSGDPESVRLPDGIAVGEEYLRGILRRRRAAIPG
jgi:hypothetical protein